MEKEKIRVLIVEDHKLAQRLAVMSIKPLLNCIIDTADNGQQAIKQFKAHHYHFIFMDLGLPDMDGYTVVETIRNLENKERHTPIVALTAHSNQNFVDTAMRVGMDDFVTKPMTMQKAREMIEKYGQRGQTPFVDSPAGK